MSKSFKLLTTSAVLSLSLALIPNNFAVAASKSNPYGTGKIDPAPANSIILKLSKGSKSINFTLKQLQALKSVTVTINEPFIKKRQSYRAILLADLFKKVGIVANDRVRTLALNDYSYTNSAANFTSAFGYLAISQAGSDIAYDQGGPIRLIFPDSSKWHLFLDAWNWSLMSIAVK